jgi:biotin-dependent carboxylase-like uncharacterized protein
LQGRALHQGDVLSIGQDVDFEAKAYALEKKYIPHYGEKITLRVLLGPQDDMFTPEAIKTFFEGKYVISNEADRMGYRLEGPKVAHVDKADIVSDALSLGAIQIPAHGMPIIMMADRQTTGGYAKIGTIIGPDLSVLAQAKPGDEVQFSMCLEEEAVNALRGERQAYADIERICRNQKKSSGIVKLYNVVINQQVYEVRVEACE